MVRKLFVLSLVLGCCFGLSACDDDGTPAPDGGPTDGGPTDGGPTDGGPGDGGYDAAM